MGALSVDVGEGARWGVSDSHTNGGSSVVGIVDVHPHYVFTSSVIADDFWALKDVGLVEVMGLVIVLCD